MGTTPRPVGVFDSGVGGVSVLKELHARLPDEYFLYFGDNANAPYGSKTPEEVRALAENALLMLRGKGAKAIVIACNTATAAAAAYLRAKYPDYPIIGMEPAIKPAALSGGHPRVLVMATPMTLKLEKFKDLESSLEENADFTVLPCPGLVERIEKGQADAPETESFLRTLLKDEIASPPDCVVLGCTHFPFVRSVIDRIFEGKARFFDGAAGTARQLERQLAERELLTKEKGRGGVLFESSAGKREIELMKSLFERPI